MSLTVPAGERGQVRVFAINLGESDARALVEKPDAAAALLGLTDLDPDFVEILPIENIAELGLPAYLHDGYDVPHEALAADRVRLSSLDGYALIVLSMAFADRAVTLNPGADLTLIGTYPTAGVDWTPRETIQTDSARPEITSPETAPTRRSDAAIGGRVAVVVLLVLAVLTYIVITVAG